MPQMNEGLKAYIAGEDLEPYRRVKLDAADTGGETVIYADADDDDIGTTDCQALDGDHVNVRLRNVPGTRKVAVASAVALGAKLFGAADGKVDDSPAGFKTGYVALQAGGGAGVIIEVLTGEKGDLLFANLANSTVLGAPSVAAEVDFDITKTIPGVQLKAGDVLEIIARAIATHTHTTDTLAMKLYVAGELIVTTGALDVADGAIAFIHAFVKIREAGATGKLAATGLACIGVEGTATAKPFRKAEAAEDLSGDVVIKASATWSAADAGNDATLEELTVIHHR